MVPPVSQRRDLSLWRIGATLAALLALPRRAEAAGPLPGPGERIQTSDYSLDLFQGPVLAGSRITGLAGAYSALAEGAEGHSFNAAAPVVRTPYSMRRTDWDATAGVTFPSSVSGTDFDNNGRTGFTYGNFVFLTAGGQIQDRRAGVRCNITSSHRPMTIIGKESTCPADNPSGIAP